jgi:archaellum component FlaF (FlaF/FlaG flagellin family)
MTYKKKIMLQTIMNRIKKIIAKKTVSETFNLEKLTALHEAAHVVCAYLSDYHSLVSQINLNSDSTGETFVSLSRFKILEKGKLPSDNSITDPEIILDAAIIFYAGFEAEKIYCNKTNSKADISHSINDYNLVETLLLKGNTSINIDKEEAKNTSQLIVKNYLDAIEEIANLLLESKSIESYTAIDYLKISFGHK